MRNQSFKLLLAMNKNVNFLLFSAITILNLTRNACGDGPIVQLPNGLIRGREDLTSQGNKFYAFEKVPYAAPPIGKLRFMPPSPAESWDGIRDTIGRNVSCYQQSADGAFESEDCLFVNIFTTKLPSVDDDNITLPVMFFMHGGGYVGGSSMWEEPGNFLDHGVVLVTINYRLGPFGFLSTEDEVIPGNNGLKDQQFAIKWTHDNI
ncbi:COesterase and/or Abhydrolase 3 domain containing protein, partial [Asbolus verrucosus]